MTSFFQSKISNSLEENYDKLNKIISQIGEILRICGIADRKIEPSHTIIMNSYISAFEHNKWVFQINKETFMNDLMSKSWMTKAEVRLTYYIAKAGLRSMLGIGMTKRRYILKPQGRDWDGPIQKIVEEVYKTAASRSEIENVLQNFQHAYRYYMRWRSKRASRIPPDVPSTRSNSSLNSSSSEVSDRKEFDVLEQVPGLKCLCTGAIRDLSKRMDSLREKYNDPMYAKVKIHVCQCKKSKQRKFGNTIYTKNCKRI